MAKGLPVSAEIFPPLFSHTKETSPHTAALEKELAETKKSLCDILENLEDVNGKMKQAEEELKMSNNLLRAVIEGITDAIFVKDLEGRIILANSAVYTLLEKPLNEILGRKNDEIFSADIAKKINTEDDMVLHSGKMQRFEREIPVNGGKTKLMLSIKSPYRDNSGKSIGLVVYIKRYYRPQKKLLNKMEKHHPPGESPCVDTCVFFK